MIRNEQIKQARLLLGLTQREMAEMLGVSANSVARWEGGSRNPGLPVMLLLRELMK